MAGSEDSASSSRSRVPVTPGTAKMGPAKSARAAQVRSLRLPPPNSSSSRGVIVAWTLVVLLTGSTGWLLVQQRGSEVELERLREEIDDAKFGAPEGPAPSVGSSDTAGPIGDIALESKGYVTAAHQILVSPQVSGRLLKLYVEEGRRVAQGEVLGEIEATEYRADYQRAAATLELNRQRLLELENGNRPEEIEQTRADLAEAEAQLVQLEAEWRRGAQLVITKSITTQEFELVESKYRAIQRRVERWKLALKLATDGPRTERIEIARAEVKQAEADVAKTKWKLDNCRILAPISGTILKKNAEEGNIVNPIAFNGSFSVCEMADLADLEVSLDIQERDISRVFQGQTCKVRAVDAYPDRIYEGVVSRLMPIADRAKGAIPVRVRLTVPSEEEGVYLKPEMGVTVSFLTAKAMKGVAADAPTRRTLNP